MPPLPPPPLPYSTAPDTPVLLQVIAWSLETVGAILEPGKKLRTTIYLNGFIPTSHDCTISAIGNERYMLLTRVLKFTLMLCALFDHLLIKTTPYFTLCHSMRLFSAKLHGIYCFVRGTTCLKKYQRRRYV